MRAYSIGIINESTCKTSYQSKIVNTKYGERVLTCWELKFKNNCVGPKTSQIVDTLDYIIVTSSDYKYKIKNVPHSLVINTTINDELLVDIATYLEHY